MPIDLLQPYLDDGIRHTNFFEGRVVSGADFKEEQDANHSHRRHLGRALGHGVVEGLDVELVSAGGAPDDPATLRVRCGLGLNRKGDMLQLPQNVDVRLQPAREEPGESTCIFSDCSEDLTTLIPSGVGLYILVMSPASGFKEEAPKSGLGSGGKVVGCGKKHQVEGVVFRLVFLSTTSLDIDTDSRSEIDSLLGSSELESVSLLRNLSAHLCFGTEELFGLPVSPLAEEDGASRFAATGAVNSLERLAVLDHCDIPLALFQWTPNGVTFVDTWSVRRRVASDAVAGRFPGALSRRHEVVREATIQQFQSHLSWLLAQHGSPSTIDAAQFFRFLPSISFLPLNSPTSSGLSAPSFLQQKTFRGPLFIEGSRLEWLLDLAGNFPPVDLRSEEMVWLYLLRENRMPGSDASPPSPTEPPIGIVTSGYMPYLGEARFDISRYEFVNNSSLLP